MIKKNAKIFALVLALVMTLSSAVFAAEGDHYMNGQLKYSSNQVRADVNARNHVRALPGEFQIEVDKGLYKLTDANTAYNKDNENWKTILKSGSEEELKVESISAINATVDETGTLKFAINGKTEAANLAKVKEAGYVVKFLASNNKLKDDSKDDVTNNNTTGIVKATAGDKFDYQVIVKKDGEKVAESERVTVEVKKFAETVTEISAIKLYVTQEIDVDVKVTSGKLAKNDIAKVVVMGRTADMKADEKDADITKNAGLTLSTDKVAIISAINKENEEITFGGAKGDVTITAKAGDITKAITVNAGNAKRAISKENSTITPASLELATGDSADIVVALKDQYGDTFVPTASNVKTDALIVEGKTLASAVKGDKVEDDLTVKLSLTAGTDAGTGKVVVNHNTTKLAEVVLTIKKAGEIATYKLETADKKYELELMGSTGNSSATLILNGYDKEGLFVDQTIALNDYKFESSDEKVATVSNNDDTTKGQVIAVAPGTAVIKVYKTEDAFQTTVAEVEIIVKDSTPTITTATVKTPDKMTVAGAVYLSDIFTKVTAVDPEGKEVEVNDFGNENVTVGEARVTIGSFLVTLVKAEEPSVNVAKIIGGKIDVTGNGKATINIALLNAKNEIVKDVNVEVDIPAVEEED